jgi:hypothetical protein
MAFIAIVFASCTGSIVGEQSTSTRETGISNEGIDNDPSTLAVGKGRILSDNPFVLNGNKDFNTNKSFNTLLTDNQVDISLTGRLQGNCIARFSSAQINNCYEVYKNEASAPLINANNQWGYSADTSEFLQVHTFGHMRKLIDEYHNVLIKTYNDTHDSGSTPYQTAIPADLYSTVGTRHWPMREDGTNEVLKAYSEYPVDDNAFFSPSEFSMGFGVDSVNSKIKLAQDPTIIYHEVGHALVYHMMNIRNTNDQSPLVKTYLKSRFYDEAGALNEGIADWFSFLSNNRTTFGQWAFGRDIDAARPFTEASGLHKVASLGSFEGGELNYPTYVNYDSHNPASRIEDIHYAGQIVTHYFVSLTNQLHNECGYQADVMLGGSSYDVAQRIVLATIQDTLAELGDITAKGNDYGTAYVGAQVEYEYKRNLNPDHAYLWISAVNPINYRRFFQTFAKKLKDMTVDYPTTPLQSDNSARHNPNCPNRQLTIDDIEKKLDDYGLLLFDTYNENGNSGLRSIQSINGSTPLGHTGTNRQVNPGNRIKSELINKNNLILDPRTDATSGFVFDGRSDMLGVLSRADGITGKLSRQIDGNLVYNNGNGQISPGEFIGLMPNIYNQSNSVMAGVQILANDWDHFKGGKPCNNLGDNFPFASEGAADLTTGEGSPGGCNYVTRDNGNDTSESIAPVCFVQVEKDGALVYAGQEDLRDSIGLDSSLCLSDNNKTDDCFIRTVPGFDHSWFSRIDPNSSWTETLQDENGKTTFQQNNLIFMEVNPNTPPGTKFNCRFRARFTNCKDCWHDSDFGGDDFLDYEFSGAEPFQIINFQFRVID